MKKTICLALALALCLVLAACQSAESEPTQTEPTVSAAVAAVTAQIDALGEISVDSLEAIEAAEAAYAALEPQDQALIDNYEVLTQARSSYKDRLYESQLVGEWYTPDAPFYGEAELTPNLSLTENGQAVYNLYGMRSTHEWSVSDGVLRLVGGPSFRISEHDGYLSLTDSDYGTNMTYLKDLFLQVKLTTENVGDYLAWTTGMQVSDPVLDNGGIAHYVSSKIVLGNLLVDEGWYYYMTGDDFRVDYSYPASKSYGYEVSTSGNLTSYGVAYSMPAGSGSIQFRLDNLYDMAAYVLNYQSGASVYPHAVVSMSTMTPDQFTIDFACGSIYFVNSDYVEVVTDETGCSRYLRLPCENWDDFFVGSQFLNHEY